MPGHDLRICPVPRGQLHEKQSNISTCRLAGVCRPNLTVAGHLAGNGFIPGSSSHWRMCIAARCPRADQESAEHPLSKVASDPIGPLVMVELSSHSVAWLALVGSWRCQPPALVDPGLPGHCSTCRRPALAAGRASSRNALLLADARAPATSRRPAVEI